MKPTTLDAALVSGAKGKTHEGKEWWRWRVTGAGKITGVSAIGAIAIALGWTKVEDRALPQSDVIRFVQEKLPKCAVEDIKIYNLEGRYQGSRSMLSKVCVWESAGLPVVEIAKKIQELDAKEDKRVNY